MANSAQLLFETLTAWSNADGATPKTKRNLGSWDGWEKQINAVQLLIDLKSQMDSLEAEGRTTFAPWSKFYVQWTTSVFAYPHGWDSSGDGINQTALDQLHGLAVHMKGFVPELDPSKKDDFHKFLDAVEQQLDEAPDALKRHALKVVRHLKSVLDDWEVLGDFRIANAMSDLQDIIDVLSEQESASDGFWHTARDWSSAFFTNPYVAGVTCGYITAALPASNFLELLP